MPLIEDESSADAVARLLLRWRKCARSPRRRAFRWILLHGYSVYQIYSGPWAKLGFNGWDTTGALKLSPNVAVEGEFGGGFASNGGGRQYGFQTYMGGPRFSGGIRKFDIFGHVLFGALHFNADYASPATSFAAALGGGADFWFKRKIGVRLIQADCLLNTNRAAAEGNNGGSGPHAHLRIAAGVTFRF